MAVLSHPSMFSLFVGFRCPGCTRQPEYHWVPLRLIVLDRAQASATRPPEPVLFLDTSAHPDVEALLAAHVEGRDGDVTVRWQVLTVHNEQRGAILYLDFAAPQPCSFHVVFPFLYGPEDTTMAVQAMALHRHVQLTTAPVPAATIPINSTSIRRSTSVYHHISGADLQADGGNVQRTSHAISVERRSRARSIRKVLCLLAIRRSSANDRIKTSLHVGLGGCPG